MADFAFSSRKFSCTPVTTPANVSRDSSHVNRLPCTQQAEELAKAAPVYGPQIAPVRTCFGLQFAPLAGLYGKSSGGAITADYYFNVIRTSAILSGIDFPKSLPLLTALEPSFAEYVHNTVNDVRAAGISLYEPTGQSLKSTFCTGSCPKGIEALVGAPCCSACSALLLDPVLKKRANKPCNAVGAAPHPKANHAYCERDHLINKFERARETIVKLFREKEHEKQAKLTAERRARRLESKLKSGINKGNYPKFIRAFQSAADDGLVPDELLQNILTDIAKSLRVNTSGTKTQRPSILVC
jgi:hypothetical protein